MRELNIFSKNLNKYTGTFLFIILSCIQLVILSLHVSVLERKRIWFCSFFPHQCQMTAAMPLFCIYDTLHPHQCTVSPLFFFFFVLNNVISNLVATVISFLQSICLLKLWGWSVLDCNESISINIFKKKWTKTCTPKTRLFSERHLIGFVLTDTPGKVMW